MDIFSEAVTHDGVDGIVGYPLRGVVQHGNDGSSEEARGRRPTGYATHLGGADGARPPCQTLSWTPVGPLRGTAGTSQHY
jgi:hypothetical protein